ncbi:flavin-containing monooxygenase [Mesorhizobium sp. B2-8-5]|uniref:flavin-containing monooxygenase n=1 Tax=Mesorhizobium sp. B2-8-5 TaxID=2589903 RepID=UPI00112E48D2|nr:NAD(P)-binding domain-containing protein [Mesorhizobium sp. B2-8-5]UCI28106.1 NAD(P)-binding domain-containing protein [Mesorhizobium sp. B2-8-5]
MKPDTLPKCCIIGAGCSGIVTAKALTQRGIPFDWYEMSDRVGGQWAFENPNGKSAAYRSLHIDTSKLQLELADFPMPADTPHYLHHTQVLAYLKSYMDHFGLTAKVKLSTEVKKADRDANGTWQIRLGDGETRSYDALFVCNGHHWDPRLPEPAYPGKFEGMQLHSHGYRDPFTPVDFTGKNVLVVGMGNSAMDIANELCPRHITNKLFVSTRRGAHIFPRFLLGKPADKGKLYPWLPLSLQRWVGRRIFHFAVGHMEDFGLPKPDHRVFEAHVSVSDTFPTLVASGDIEIRPGIRELDGDSVVFEDGRREKIDIIVWATGYKVSFPFFDPSLISAPGNRLPLFKRVLKPGIPNLFFIALAQPSITLFALADRQAKWIATYLAGDYALPDVEEQKRTIVADEKKHMSRYYASARHTMQLDQDIYFSELEGELKRGRKRARSLGFGRTRLPVPRVADVEFRAAAE